MSHCSIKQPPRSYFGHRKRLRQRFEAACLDGFHDYEIMELVLTYAIPRRDTKPLAKILIQRFKDLSGVLDASIDDLLSIPGIGPKSAQLLTLFKPVCVAYLRNRLRSSNVIGQPQDVINYCRMAFAGKSHEVVHSLYLDTKNRIIAEKTISEGTIDESAVYPRRLIEEALSCHASAFILVHNHPSGQVQPSPEDKELTRKIWKTVQAIDLRFLDHLIIGTEGYYSFQREGFFDFVAKECLSRVNH